MSGFMTQEEYDPKYVPKTKDVQRNYLDVWRSPNPLDISQQAQREWDDFVRGIPPESTVKQSDFVNPDHYRTNGIECIEYQRATSTPEEFQGYLKNCCVKYLHRMRTKDDPLKNLLKAQWYLNRLVEEFKKQ